MSRTRSVCKITHLRTLANKQPLYRLTLTQPPGIRPAWVQVFQLRGALVLARRRPCSPTKGHKGRLPYMRHRDGNQLLDLRESQAFPSRNDQETTCVSGKPPWPLSTLIWSTSNSKYLGDPYKQEPRHSYPIHSSRRLQSNLSPFYPGKTAKMRLKTLFSLSLMVTAAFASPAPASWTLNGALANVFRSHNAQPSCISNQKVVTDTLYESPTPASTQQHRYTFLVYRQPPGYVPDTVTLQVRPGLNIYTYAASKGLKLVGGNFLRESITNP